MNDLISRQAAIDALAELARDRFTVQDVFQVYLDALKDADMRIRQLPSAQPEIIRCKDCRYYGESLPGIDKRMICYAISLNFEKDFYCAFAERREGCG